MQYLRMPELTESQALALARHHRELARSLLITAATLVLVVVLTYQLQEHLLPGSLPGSLWQQAGWRAVAVLTAVFALAWSQVHKDGYGAIWVLRLLALSVMIMMFGLFALHWMAESGDIERVVRGVIICTFAVSLFSLSGSRELLVFFGFPLLVMLTVMHFLGQSVIMIFGTLFDPVMMFVVAAIASEVLYRTWLDAFVANQRLAEHAATDPLTGLSNRRHIEPQLAGETASANRHDSTFSILMADLDHFKQVNDTHGHDVGDEVLREVARRMRALLRTEDRPVRWGGEEFLVLLTNTDAEQAGVVAEKIRRAIAEAPIECNGASIDITISLGVAEYRGEHDPLEIIRRADRALYQAKDEGRNRVCMDAGKARAQTCSEVP